MGKMVINDSLLNNCPKLDFSSQKCQMMIKMRILVLVIVTAVDHRWPPATAAGHHWPPATAAGHRRRPPLTAVDHRRRRRPPPPAIFPAKFPANHRRPPPPATFPATFPAKIRFSIRTPFRDSIRDSRPVSRSDYHFGTDFTNRL